jgi:hypothetical protein
LWLVALTTDAKKADHQHRGLLRARCKRPPSRRTD